MTEDRKIRVEGEVAFVPLTQGYEAKIDLSDIALVEGLLWAALRRGNKVYAGRSVWRNGTNRAELMHRVIMQAKPDQLVDHRDGDGLNNTFNNLRIASRSQNAMNSGPHKDNKSGFKGVCWSKQKGMWKAEICANGIRKHIGLYKTREEAAQGYRQAAKKIHGKFARFE